MKFGQILEVLRDVPRHAFHHTSEYRHTFKDDVRLQLVVSEESESFSEPWTDKFLDKAARRYEVTVEFAGVPVHTFFFVATDGGRYFIPLPNLKNGLKIDALQYNLAQIIDGGTEDIDQGLERAGIQRVQEHAGSLSW